jgi:hypothetical protein
MRLTDKIRRVDRDPAPHPETPLVTAMTTKRFLLSLLPALALAVVLGCDPDPQAERPAPPPGARPQEKKPPVRKVELARNLFLEVQGEKRRVLVSAAICLRKGPLELLMTRKDTKEHEAIIAADVDARRLRVALELAKATPGSPVKFDPRYVPASGQVIKITVAYEDKARKVVHVRAQDWIRDARTQKPLAHDWVFTGSKLVPNPLEKNKPIFLANDGDLVCVSNFESALLDLPIKSSKANSELAFEANSDKIPPVGTRVTVIFEPVAKK